jgi:hypothetical protein
VGLVERFKDLSKEKGWVVVKKDGSVKHFETFSEANQEGEGNLMTETFYKYHFHFHDEIHHTIWKIPQKFNEK